MKSMFKNAILTTMSCVGIVAIANGSGAPSQVSQPRDHGMYASFLWTPVVFGNGLPEKAKNDTAGVFSYPYGFGGSLGYQFNRYIAVEFTGWTAVTNFYNAAIDAKLMLPLTQAVNIYAKLGGDVINYKDVFDNSYSGSGPFVALGIGIQLTPRFDLNLEESTYSWIRNNGYFTAVNTAGLGVTYHF